MKTRTFTRIFSLFAMAMIVFASCKKSDDMVVTPPPPPPPPPTPVVKPDQLFFGLSANNQLVKYNANASQTAISTVAITGLQPSESMLAIDFRPATGQLYGVGTSSRVYVINPLTGVARAVGAPFTPALIGVVASFDFNPTVDRIRVVTNVGENIRLNPETGALAATDGNINPAAKIIGVAYNNNYSGAATTTLYDIDGNNFFMQNPPNNGVLVTVGSLGLVADNTGADFDISPDNTVAIGPMTVGGVNSLYQYNLTTGAVTNLGKLVTPLISLAIPTDPVAYSTDAANNLVVFNFLNPGTAITKPITGLQPGESVLGLDMRPATGQLYALGSTSRVYAINMSNGAATAMNATPFTPALSGTNFGFDFNPTVDRIRVVSNTGQNLRLDPNTGLVAAIDGNINPGTPAISGSAYTNNFGGATTTTLYALDATTDRLYMQNPPNAGTLVDVGPLGINITADNGFDIGGTSNTAYALVTIATFSKVVSINLATGAVTPLADYPALTKGFAVGLGF